MFRVSIFPALLTLLTAMSSPAETPSPKVWLDLDQAALDAAYNQAVYAPNLEQVLERQAANSVLARQHLGEPQRHRYGPSEDEQLDVYPTDQPDAPILIFVHGGAWKLGFARDNAHAAEAFVRNGVHFVVPDFSPVQTFDGDLQPMVDQLQRAVAWVHEHAAETFGGNPDRIHLAGFSSGGHLAAVLSATDWTEVDDLPADLIKGSVLCSGMYDLTPVSLSARSEYVRFTPGMVAALSPLKHLARIQAPVVVAVGTYETPEFQRQAHAFAEALALAGKEITLIIGAGYNHFEMAETFGHPYSLLGRAALEQIHAAP